MFTYIYPTMNGETSVTQAYTHAQAFELLGVKPGTKLYRYGNLETGKTGYVFAPHHVDALRWIGGVGPLETGKFLVFAGHLGVFINPVAQF